ncbi:hypothetical protein [Acinetobacter sp. ANC 3791]|uniref:hypothetical protein n=1 Tax=Acinetobacter sp. ANC 3791 TaxID=2529836 RepID=UPI001038B70A|nr:hypothetical protein [Acinetobacter sp. ANC 3791]TCB83181.1 hypothetical protein E0H90_12795 [Acinetobacter sp. ANC 3791]
MSNIDPKSLEVGQKIKFDNDHYWYVVHSVRHPFVICTTSSSKGYYAILDVDQNIRGEGTSWGLGHKMDEEIAQEISRRNRVPLNIVQVQDFTHLCKA